MKNLISIFAAAVLALSLLLGCTPAPEPEDVPAPPETPAAEQEEPSSEPESAKKIVEDYGTGLVTSMDKARAAQDRVDIREVQRAVQDYALSHDGEYPPSLDAVKDSMAGEIDLGAFVYDPSNGAVRLRREP